MCPILWQKPHVVDECEELPTSVLGGKLSPLPRLPNLGGLPLPLEKGGPFPLPLPFGASKLSWGATCQCCWTRKPPLHGFPLFPFPLLFPRPFSEPLGFPFLKYNWGRSSSWGLASLSSSLVRKCWYFLNFFLAKGSWGSCCLLLRKDWSSELNYFALVRKWATILASGVYPLYLAVFKARSSCNSLRRNVPLSTLSIEYLAFMPANIMFSLSVSCLAQSCFTSLRDAFVASSCFELAQIFWWEDRKKPATGIWLAL